MISLWEGYRSKMIGIKVVAREKASGTIGVVKVAVKVAVDMVNRGREDEVTKPKMPGQNRTGGVVGLTARATTILAKVGMRPATGMQSTTQTGTTTAMVAVGLAQTGLGPKTSTRTGAV